MKVLMSAYACEPGKGSEPGVGWHWALQAARHNDVWVITRTNNRRAIQAELARAPCPNLHFIYHDLPRWAIVAKRSFLGVRGYYLLWQISALKVVREHHRQVGFDVIHHVTFNPIDSPGLLWMLDVPFVWGPVGGAQVPPAALRRYYGWRWLLERIRIARKRLIPWSPLVRLALRSTDYVLAANADTETLLRRLGVARLSKELETAIEIPPGDLPGSPVNPQFTVLWVGRLSHRKAPMLALDVVQELKRLHIDVRLIIVGDGPLRARVNGAIAARGLGSQVILTGPIPYSGMSRLYRGCDAFLFTSLQDTSGNVLLEAMAHGLPVISLDHHGAAEIVTPECGVKIPIHTASQVVSDMVAAIAGLAQQPETARRMGIAGHCRARDRFSWDAKGELLAQVYDGLGTT